MKFLIQKETNIEDAIKRCNLFYSYNLDYTTINNNTIEIQVLCDNTSIHDKFEIINDIEDMKLRISLENDFARIREIIIRKALS